MVWEMAYNDVYEEISTCSWDQKSDFFHQRTTITAHFEDGCVVPRLSKVSCVVRQPAMFHVSRHARKESLRNAQRRGHIATIPASKPSGMEHAVFAPENMVLQLAIGSPGRLQTTSYSTKVYVLKFMVKQLAKNPVIGPLHTKMSTIHFIIDLPPHPHPRLCVCRCGESERLLAEIMSDQMDEEWSVRWLSFDSKELRPKYAPRQVFGKVSHSFSVHGPTLTRLAPIEVGCYYETGGVVAFARRFLGWG
jgi:hypothetical protein